VGPGARARIVKSGAQNNAERGPPGFGVNAESHQGRFARSWRTREGRLSGNDGIIGVKKRGRVDEGFGETIAEAQAGMICREIQVTWGRCARSCNGWHVTCRTMSEAGGSSKLALPMTQ